MSAKKTLHVHVGEPLAHSLARMADTTHAIDRGESPEPRFDLGFEDMAQLLAVFTPRRWEIEKTPRGQIVAPFSEIAMDVQLPQQKAA